MFSFGALALVLHFFLVFLYATRTSVPNRSGYIAQAYVYPFFEQSWNLFAPPPNANYALYVYSKDRNSKPRELLGEILHKHQENRLKGYEPFLIGLVNSIYYFEKSADANETKAEVKNNLYFKVIEHFLAKYLDYFQEGDSKNKKIILLVKDFGKSPRVFYN